MALGFETPLTTDARMQDLLERAFLVRVGEHYGANLLSIQAFVPGVSPRAKLLLDQSPHLRVSVSEIPGRDIRIKKPRLRSNLSETGDETRFPGGNSAGDPDGWHFFRLSVFPTRPINLRYKAHTSAGNSREESG